MFIIVPFMFVNPWEVRSVRRVLNVAECGTDLCGDKDLEFALCLDFAARRDTNIAVMIISIVLLLCLPFEACNRSGPLEPVMSA